MPNLEGDLVRSRELWYADRSDYIDRMTKRSEKYLFEIVVELERRKMPSELALLPFVESAFNPQAVSGARATGMWQFSTSTGRNFSLQSDIFRDDRRDVVASTRAALDYLQRLYQFFGDWQLVLMAYNWGEGNVSRMIARNAAAGLPVRYSDLNMPSETRNYVSKLQAIKNVIANPSAFGLTLPEIADRPYFESVSISRDMDVAIAASLARVSVEDFRALNPGVTSSVIIASRTPQVLLPWSNAEVFKHNLETLQDTQLSTWMVWTVPDSMTPTKAAQYFAMSESEFRAVNALPAGAYTIQAGSALIVPRHSNSIASAPGPVNASLNLIREPLVKVVSTRTNDTVESIAKRYGMSVDAFLALNLTRGSGRFKQGQKVVVIRPK